MELAAVLRGEALLSDPNEYLEAEAGPASEASASEVSEALEVPEAPTDFPSRASGAPEA